MGFARDRAIEALKAKRNKDDALDWLLSNPTASPTKPINAVTATTTTTTATTASSSSANRNTKDPIPPTAAKKTGTRKSKAKSTAPKKLTKKASANEVQAAMDRAKERMLLAQEEDKRIAGLQKDSTCLTNDHKQIMAEEEAKRKDKEKQALLQSIQKDKEEAEMVRKGKEELKQKKTFC